MQLTALQIMRQAAAELGLTVPTEVAASTEVTGQQLLAHLNSAGLDLIVAHPWQELNVTYTFSTVTAQAGYDLPSDYEYYIDQTFWSAADGEPVYGPVSPQVWQRIVAGSVALPADRLFRVHRGQMELLPAPSDIENMTYQYVSNLWVQCSMSPPTCKSLITADADIPILDANLLIKALKVKMWASKGMDTTTLTGELTGLFNSLTGKDKGATVLSMSKRSRGSLLGPNNAPEGNW